MTIKLSSLKKSVAVYNPVKHLSEIWEEPTIEKIEEFERKLLELPQVEIPVEHYTADDVYVRKVVIPKGAVATGSVHKYSHISILISGRMIIWTPEKGVHEVVGPCITVTKPGMKRAGIALEDTVWATAHGIPGLVNDAEIDNDRVVDYLTVTSNAAYLKFIQDNTRRVIESSSLPQLSLWPDGDG